jgi:cyclic pyranopterin phosphate synthase
VTLSTLDSLGRPLRDLRISVTDRCNFRCRYCMPRESFSSEFQFLDRASLLTFEEVTRVAKPFVALGVRKLRLTGGEPLLRREVERLIEMLSELGTDLSMTTNGSLLENKARTLRRAGLERLTVSVDSLDPRTFASITDGGVELASVLDGIHAAREAGFERIKINSVIRRGQNDHEVVRIARHFTELGCIVRFIEFMDVGETNGWQRGEVVTAREILDRLRTEFAVRPLAANYTGEVAERYSIDTGEVGIINSVSKPFCGDCTRARLSADGRFYGCLFATQGSDLKGPLRAGIADSELERLVAQLWARRGDRYSEQRSELIQLGPRVEMSYIGG